MNTIVFVLRLFYSMFVWLYVGMAFFLHYLMCRAVFPFVKEKAWLSIRMANVFTRGALFLLGIRLNVNSLEKVLDHPHFILIANHQSLADIPILMVSLPFYFNFFAKQSLLRVPFLGWEIQHQGHFVVNREQPKIAVKQMQEVRKKIENGRNILIFPEGTRSLDGKLGPFKRGAFVLAVQTGIPIIPCYLEGTGKVVPKKGLMRPGKIGLYFGDVIPVEKIKKKSEEKEATKALMAKTRLAICQLQKKGTI